MEQTKLKTQALKKGTVIFREGDSAACMYDILWGRVGIYVNYGEAGERLLTELTAEQYFGEMGMIDHCPRSATAVALENNTQVRVITEESFQDYFRENPAKVLTIMQHMSSRIRGLSQDYLEACRAVVEAAEVNPGKEKSSWLKDNLKRFVEDYETAAKMSDRYSRMDPGSPAWFW